MNKNSAAICIVLLSFLALSCGLVDRFTKGGPDNLKRVQDLWPDVPKMDGLDPSDMEMPFAVKLLMRTALNNLWRLNEKNEDKTPVSGDWLVFSSVKTSADVQSFYTNDRMTTFGGWEASKKSTCLDGKENGIDGALCLFQKIADGKDIKLAIIAMKDGSTKRTNIFFLRLEQEAKDRPANTPGPAPVAEKHRGPIVALTGTAPYGIEKRPMPSGVDIDKLLPKQVGPYERAKLEKSLDRGTTPTTIEADGNSIYATYRNGEKEVFLEFAVNGKAEEAQNSLDVSASDVISDGFPTDPKVGSLGTEPSYLKVSTESGAFIGWTRGGYFFTANAKGGETDLDAFMNAFPY